MSENAQSSNDIEHEQSHVSACTDGGSDVAAATVSDTYDDATTRDRVWSAAVRLLARRQPLGFRLFQVREEAGLDKSKDRTIRRALNAMQELGWLERGEDEKYWYPGEPVTEIVEADIPEREPLEKIDERIDHLEDCYEHAPQVQPDIPKRVAELELVRDRITADAPSEKLNGGGSGE